MKKNKLTQIGLISIITSIVITLIGLFYAERIIILIGLFLFGNSITFLVILPVFLLKSNKSENNPFRKNFKPKNCQYCGHLIPEDAKKCHICGKKFQ